MGDSHLIRVSSGYDIISNLSVAAFELGKALVL